MSVEWVAAGVAIVAALFAGWQAFEANRARAAAKESAADAQRLVAAAERSAAAHEEQAALIRRAQEKYENPFRIERKNVARGSKRWKLALGGTETLTGVSVEIDWKDSRVILHPNPTPDVWTPGQATLIDWFVGGGSPRFITLTVRWTRPNGEEHDFSQALD